LLFGTVDVDDDDDDDVDDVTPAVDQSTRFPSSIPLSKVILSSVAERRIVDDDDCCCCCCCRWRWRLARRCLVRRRLRLCRVVSSSSMALSMSLSMALSMALPVVGIARYPRRAESTTIVAGCQQSSSSAADVIFKTLGDMVRSYYFVLRSIVYCIIVGPLIPAHSR